MGRDGLRSIVEYERLGKDLLQVCFFLPFSMWLSFGCVLVNDPSHFHFSKFVLPSGVSPSCAVELGRFSQAEHLPHRDAASLARYHEHVLPCHAGREAAGAFVHSLLERSGLLVHHSAYVFDAVFQYVEFDHSAAASSTGKF